VSALSSATVIPVPPTSVSVSVSVSAVAVPEPEATTYLKEYSLASPEPPPPPPAEVQAAFPFCAHTKVSPEDPPSGICRCPPAVEWLIVTVVPPLVEAVRPPPPAK